MKAWEERRFFYNDFVRVFLPENHRFPMSKYRLLREALVSRGIIAPEQMVKAIPVSEEDVLRVHTAEYVDSLRTNTLDPKEARPIGLPVGPELYERSLTSVGGFIMCTEQALKDGFSALLAGGTHHAFADHGEGYCVLNDFAVAATRLLQLNHVKRILILDLDVHQGNGTSAILGQSQDVFIVSLHGERNYPFRKVPSHWDVPLPAGIGDEGYLSALVDVLQKLETMPFDLMLYQAGVDVLEFDSLGTFKLSFDGVRARDRLVFEFAKKRSLPVAMAIGGGYSKPIEQTVEAYVGTFLEAKRVFNYL
jgi:acetoin utilization deacetylase AcuC-like enzyme